MPRPYIIQGGDTLGQLAVANKTDVGTLLQLNPNITDPNKIFAGRNLNLPDLVQPTIPMAGQNQAIVSSDQARTQFNNNLQTLPQMEGQFVAGKGTLMPDGTYSNPPTSKADAGQPPAPAPILNASTGNPALKTLFDSTNKLLQDLQAKGGTLTPEMQQKIQAINDAETQKLGAVAGARTAADGKNALTLDSSIKTAKTAESTQSEAINALLADLKTQRETYISSLALTQPEIDLQTKLNTLRTDRQLLPLELRQEGISAPGIAGRQGEDERVRAIQEQNLLLELGLKQKAREMSTTAAEKQVGFIKDDITLQNTIQQQLTEQENKVLEQARNLRQDSLNALDKVSTQFKGLAWTDLDPQTQADTLNLLKSYPDITPKILADVLAIQKKQQVFDNAIKAKNAEKTGSTNGNKLTLAEARTSGLPLALVGMSEADIANDLSLPTSPDWFKRFVEEKAGASMTSSAIAPLWKEFQSKMVSKSGSFLKPPAQTSSVGDTLTATKDSLRQYKDAGYSRAEVEDQWKQANGQTATNKIVIPTPIKALFDEIWK